MQAKDSSGNIVKIQNKKTVFGFREGRVWHIFAEEKNILGTPVDTHNNRQIRFRFKILWYNQR